MRPIHPGRAASGRPFRLTIPSRLATAAASLVLLASFALATSARAQGATPPAKPAPGAKSKPAAPASATRASAARGAPDAEERRYIARAAADRARILALAGWADLGQRCDPGHLRAFEDTTATSHAARDSVVADLERAILSRGLDEPLDTPAARALLRTVVLWEAGSARPLWDDDRADTNRAVATGLTGQYYNEEHKQCESFVPDDSVIVVTPAAGAFTLPRRSGGGMPLALYQGGAAALPRVRDAFYNSVGARDTSAVLTYTRVAPMVVWRDWAVVVVNRPTESRGIRPLEKGAGGARYIFHRVKGEWRLLLIADSW